jgi:periplasmic protein TonB
MKKNDTIGMSVSVLLHALVLLGFGFMLGTTPEPQQLGYVAIEFGPMAEGRAVRQGEPTPNAPQQTPEREQERQQQVSPPQTAKPVELPDEQIDDPEQIQTAETDNVSPQQQNNPEDVIAPETRPEQQPVTAEGGGTPDGTTGEADGAQGTGTDATRSSPYNVEGLRRTILSDPLPANVANTNAVLTFRVVVNPAGRVGQLFPLRKGNPALEQAAMNALRQWRFNPLPAAAPQVNQEGTITFRFVAR